MRKIDITLALLMMLGAGIVGAIAQTSFTSFVNGLPVATVPLTGAELVPISQGTSPALTKQVSVTNLRGANQVTISGTPTAGNCVQWVTPTSIGSASGPCVVPGPNPFLTAN